MKRIRNTFLFLSLALFLAGNAAPPRVVSLSPALTELVFRLGAEANLVGRSRVCDYPAEAKKIPVVGEMGIPHLEAVLAARPDVVICDNPCPGKGWAFLKKSGVRVEFLPNRHIADYPVTVKKLGVLLERSREAEREIARFNAALNELRKTRPKKPVATFIVLGVHPLVTCGAGSFVTELVELAGGRNIAEKVKTPYFVVSAEYVLAHPPEAVIVTGMEGALPELEKLPGWKTLPAVKSGRVVENLPPELCCRLGPRTPEAVKKIRRALKR